MFGPTRKELSEALAKAELRLADLSNVVNEIEKSLRTRLDPYRYRLAIGDQPGWMYEHFSAKDHLEEMDAIKSYLGITIERTPEVKSKLVVRKRAKK